MTTLQQPIDLARELREVRAQLIEQSHLFEAPSNYEAGVLDALDAVASLLAIDAAELTGDPA